jgi:hypothetical protein
MSMVEGRMDVCRQRWRDGCHRGDDVMESVVDFKDRGEKQL